MRALLLLVLGAGLVWFVWKGVGGGKSGERDAQAAAPGSMISIEPDAAGSGADGGSLAVSEAIEKAPTSKAADAPDAERSAVVPVLAIPASGASSSSSLAANAPAGRPAEPQPGARGAFDGAAEIAAAEELLRDPAGLGAWLALRGVELPTPRREFAAGLAHAFAGQEQDARAAIDRAAQSGDLGGPERSMAMKIVAGEDEDATSPIASSSPLARAASMKLRERAGLKHLSVGSAREAAACFSQLLLAEVASPWSADAGRLGAWSDRLHEAQLGNRWNRRMNWPSTEVVVQPGDSLISVRKRAIADRPGLVVCTGQIARANQLDGEMIHPGMKLRIPIDPVRVLVDLDAHWAFYFAGDEVVAAWPVGVGKGDSATRVGTFRVGEKKKKDPMWFPSGRKPVAYGDPANPLGTRWIPWIDAEGAETGLGFHGTNEPESIGKDASLGCIRMRTPDVEQLFEILPVGAQIQVAP